MPHGKHIRGRSDLPNRPRPLPRLRALRRSLPRERDPADHRLRKSEIAERRGTAQSGGAAEKRSPDKMSRGFVCLGLMSGTSMDGIDAVLAKITPAGDTTLAHVSFPYSKSLRDELFRAVAKPLLSLENFGALDARIGGAFAAAAVKCIRTARAKKIRADVDVIGSHGQTVFHNPQRLVSLQLGSPQ